MPVMSRPTMRVWIVSVPSKVWMDSMSAMCRMTWKSSRMRTPRSTPARSGSPHATPTSRPGIRAFRPWFRALSLRVAFRAVSGPGQVGAAVCGGGQLEGTAVAFGAAAHAGQAAGAGGRAEAAAVVGDAEGDQPVLEHQGDGGGGGAGVACAVGQGFAGDGENVMSQRLVRAGVERAGEADAGGEAELRGVLVDDLHDPGGQPGGGLAGLVEPEDAGADLADDLVQVLNVAADLCRGRGVGAGGVALHPHAEGEQVLDDVVVQVARDPVVVFDLGQGALVVAGPGESAGRCQRPAQRRPP